MKTSLISAALVAVLVAGAVATLAFAQGGGPVPHGQNIAVIDVGVIFEQHVRFKAQMDQLKADIAQTEKQWKEEATAINALVEQLKAMKPDSPDYHRLEAEVAQRQGDFNVKKALANRDLMERQGKIYFNTYREVESAVAEFCHQYNVSLVIRYSSKPIEGTDPQEILRGIQRPIVFVDKLYDITGDISKMLNHTPPDRSANVPGSQGVPR